MTFGTDWGIGSDQTTARTIFQRYLDAGGNFFDTADGYTNGKSEEMLGQFMVDAKNRDSCVVATKYTFNRRPGDPNAGGNSRKRMMEAVEGSLKRLKTDYIDLYWLHAWDALTPEEEVMSAFDTLVRQGKVRYIGLSDTPAWYVASCQRLAHWRGWEPLCSLQLEYSLVERSIEREHIPAARHFGLGVCPWSPLAGGLLSGKYKRDKSGEGRLKTMEASPNPVFAKMTDRNFDIVDVLVEVANAIGATPAQVALKWVSTRPGVSSTIIGATKLPQLEDNLKAMTLTLPAEHSAKLDEASRPALEHPYVFFTGHIHAAINGGVPVTRHPSWEPNE